MTTTQPPLKHLGRKSGSPVQYDAAILEAIPRSLNRETYHITSADPGFTGFDVWHAWEVSFLMGNGLPVVGVLKIIIPQDSPSIVESKSLKLYLNALNMTLWEGATREESIQKVVHTVEEDLSKLLKTNLTVSFFTHAEMRDNDYAAWDLLEEQYDFSSLTFDAYRESPDLLHRGEGMKQFRLGTHLLRSNCRVTFQPDWGSVFIHFKGDRGPSPEGLMRYLVSFRNENHFHEEVCEMIYKRLWDAFLPEELMVCCVYTRRGGIDITPVRAHNSSLLPSVLLNPSVIGSKLLRG
ncbi:MAG: NADPH-dependent 7-cyano-7-deazaguanine reductase QueF [Bacteroidetes bacterium]|nr:MAG: NADPH-dependent 7-cyano-7-deazaguanine reductase QueF [Bacteroidota bacterium]